MRSAFAVTFAIELDAAALELDAFAVAFAASGADDDSALGFWSVELLKRGSGNDRGVPIVLIFAIGRVIASTRIMVGCFVQTPSPHSPHLASLRDHFVLHAFNVNGDELIQRQYRVKYIKYDRA